MALPSDVKGLITNYVETNIVKSGCEELFSALGNSIDINDHSMETMELTHALLTYNTKELSIPKKKTKAILRVNTNRDKLARIRLMEKINQKKSETTPS
jgi:uncharacterized protein (DUF39 family)